MNSASTQPFLFYVPVLLTLVSITVLAYGYYDDNKAAKKWGWVMVYICLVVIAGAYMTNQSGSDMLKNSLKE